MDLITSLRDHTARVVKDFVACGPKGVCSRATLLALTALGILATGGAGSAAALLSGFGINIGASALFEFLQKLSDGQPCGATVEDALTAVQTLGEQEQAALQQVADRVDILPMLFTEALAQHRHELIVDIGNLLATWGSALPFARIEALLSRIGEETRGISAAHGDVLVIQEQLSALRSGLVQDLDGQVAPLTAEVQALRRQVDALLAQMATTSSSVASRPARPRAGRMGRTLTAQVMAAIQEELRRETGGLLS